MSLIIILAVVAGGYWLYSKSQMQAAPAADTSQAPQAKMSPEAGRAVGVWQSVDDAKFTREFREDGTVTDTYEGDAATITGSWSQVIDVAAEPFQFPAVGDATFLKLLMGSETMYVAISADTTADKLVLLNLSGNGVLTFTRAQ